MNYNNIKNKEEMKAIFEANEKYFNNNTINIGNIDKFITFFKNEIKIDTYELRFIVSIFLELDYFKKYLSDDVELDINDFKSIITTRVTEILKKATNENNFIYALVDSIDLKLDNKKDDIEHNYKIVKNMINKNKIKYNYCYLFDDVKYFNDNPDKKNNYFLFLTMILKNSI